MAQKKTAQNKLPPAKNKAVVKSVPAKTVIAQPAKRVVMTSEDIKNVMIENQNLRKEVAELKERNNMLTSILLTSGITVEEKFGDAEIEELRIPSMKEVSGYKDLGDESQPRSIYTGRSVNQWDNEEDEDMD